MFTKVRAVLGILCLSMLTGVSGFAVALDAVNVEQPMPQIVTAGQPSAADLANLKAQGVTEIINLRTEAEAVPFDEKAAAQALGLEYISLPIAGAAGLTRENAERLDALLAGNEKVFLHCASSNRAGALLALRERMVKGASVEDALALGRAAGLRSLEDAVKTLLTESRAAGAVQAPQ